MLFTYFLAVSRGVQTLNSLTRDQTCAPCTGVRIRVLTTGPQGSPYSSAFQVLAEQVSGMGEKVPDHSRAAQERPGEDRAHWTTLTPALDASPCFHFSGGGKPIRCLLEALSPKTQCLFNAH